jgi:AcrR family transcriptional regulator
MIHLQSLKEKTVNARLKNIYESASTLFIRQGYSRTQISHIAKAVGVSVGTIYHDFTGKKEIMQFVLKCTIMPDFMEKNLKRPITGEVFENLEMEIEDTFNTVLRDFSEQSARTDTPFAAFISDAFDLVARYAAGLLFIEKNQYEFEKLAGYYRNFRNRFLETMTCYFNQYIGRGVIRKPRFPQYAVAHIIETITWWGMDIRYCAFNQLDISREQAKEVVLDNLVPAYICTHAGE